MTQRQTHTERAMSEEWARAIAQAWAEYAEGCEDEYPLTERAMAEVSDLACRLLDDEWATDEETAISEAVAVVCDAQ